MRLGALFLDVVVQWYRWLNSLRNSSVESTVFRAMQRDFKGEEVESKLTARNG